MPLNFVSSLKTSINDSGEDGLTRGRSVACWVVGVPRSLVWFLFHHKPGNNHFIYLAEVTQGDLYVQSRIFNPSVFTLLRVSVFPW